MSDPDMRKLAQSFRGDYVRSTRCASCRYATPLPSVNRVFLPPQATCRLLDRTIYNVHTSRCNGWQGEWANRRLALEETLEGKQKCKK